MKDLSKINYSHPVLRKHGKNLASDYGDIFNFAFELEIRETHPANGNVSLICKSVLNDHRHLDKMIREGEAVICLTVNCPSTFFRDTIKGDQSRFEGEEPFQEYSSKELRGKVHFDATIVTTKEVSEFKPIGLHSDYGDTSFELPKGSIIAHHAFNSSSVFGTTTEILYESESIFEVIQGEDETPPRKVNLEEDDKIRIYLSPSVFDWYKRERETHGEDGTIITAALYSPVLMDVLWELSFSSHGHEKKTWFGVIKNRWTTLKIQEGASNVFDPGDGLSIVEAADKLLSIREVPMMEAFVSSYYSNGPEEG